MAWPSVLIVADDLTGALDSSAGFAVRGLRVVVARTPAHLDAARDRSADVVAVSTQTREADADTALRVLGEMAEALRDCTSILFKKVDSRLKGHAGLETRALARLRTGPVLVCPAVPRLGRVVQRGMVSGAGVSTPIPVVPAFDGLAVEVADVVEEGDFDRLLGRSLEGVLLVGAAGLADALARRLVPFGGGVRVPGLALPAVFAVGTRDPVTLAQLRVLEARGGAIHCVNASGGLVDVATLPASDIHVIRPVPSGEPLAPAEVAANLAATAAAAVERFNPATLFASGGECADAILADLDANLLDVVGEALPGLPVCTARPGGRSLHVVTKSGGFGGPATLAILCDSLGTGNQESSQSRPA